MVRYTVQAEEKFGEERPIDPTLAARIASIPAKSL